MYFILKAVIFGVGLAMDAFSVSLANGLHEPNMRPKKEIFISLIFGFFQFLMPIIGWFCVSFLVETFTVLQPYIPYVSFILLFYIGGKMIYETIKGENEETVGVGNKELIIQGLATSIDALSVGFTISTLGFYSALMESIIIGLVTFAICYIGIKIGKTFGNKFRKKASIFGGLILIFIGLEILLKGVY